MIVKRNRVTVALIAAALAVIFPMRAIAQTAEGNGATPSPTPMMLPALPHVTLSPMPGYGPAPLFVGFMVGSSDPGGSPFQTFRWNFGDGQVSTLPPTALFHTFTKPGSYVVTVTATTADGHQATAFAGVIVTPPTL
jgi:PKD repeat protein